MIKRIIRKIFQLLGLEIHRRPLEIQSLQLESIEAIMRKNNDFVDLKEWSYVEPDIYISSYNNILCDAFFKKLAQTLHCDGKTLLSVREMWNIYNWVKKTQEIVGDIAEVGVYRGGSAKLISEVKGKKKLFLFDTFEGIPQVNKDIDLIAQGSITGDSSELVRTYLSGYNNIKFVSGIFPSSAQQVIKDITVFSFVHLDVDVYPSTLDSLKFFYPKMSLGGVILTHDYRCLNTPGVKKAYDDFFSGKPETIIELWDTQAMIVKL